MIAQSNTGDGNVAERKKGEVDGLNAGSTGAVGIGATGDNSAIDAASNAKRTGKENSMGTAVLPKFLRQSKAGMRFHVTLQRDQG
jgi:hypothetical protein